MSTPDEDAPLPPGKYWTAVADKKGEGMIWVGSEYRPDWRKRVVGGDRRKRPAVHGSKHYLAKLSEADIPSIHLAYRQGESMASLSRRYSVSIYSIREIIRYKTWVHAWDGGPSLKTRRSISPRGNANSSAKLSVDKVHEIRKLYRNGITQQKIAVRFGVSKNAIGSVLRGETWCHVPNFSESPVRRNRARGEKNSAKLNESKVLDIRASSIFGETFASIARRYCVSQTTIRAIVSRRKWAHVPDA